MKIELLYLHGCPSRGGFLPRLHELLAQADVDIEPGAGERTDYGLKCRLYPTEEGLRGAPPDEWVLDALQHAGRRAG